MPPVHSGGVVDVERAARGKTDAGLHHPAPGGAPRVRRVPRVAQRMCAEAARRPLRRTQAAARPVPGRGRLGREHPGRAGLRRAARDVPLARCAAAGPCGDRDDLLPDRARTARRVAGRLVGARNLRPRRRAARRAATGPSPESWGLRAVVVATDYVGLGPKGERHTYLSGPAEGHSVIDIVRAARRIPWVHAGRQWVTVGVSQGGHASLFAGELARRYAPELELGRRRRRGAGLEPDRDVPRRHAGGDRRRHGAWRSTAGPRIILRCTRRTTSRRSPPTRAKVLDTGCVNEISLAIATIPHDQLFTHDPRVDGAGPVGRDRQRSRSRAERGADPARPGDCRHRRGPGPHREAPPAAVRAP